MKRGTIILALAYICIIPAIIIWPGLRIASAWRAGHEAARDQYSILRRNAINSISIQATVASETWRATAHRLWNENDRLLAIVISDPERGVLFALPDSSSYYRAPRANSASPEFWFPDSTVARFSAVISSGLTLDALYVTLRQGDVYRPIRDAFLALTVIIILTASWLVAATAGATSRKAPQSLRDATEQPVGPDRSPSGLPDTPEPPAAPAPAAPAPAAPAPAAPAPAAPAPVPPNRPAQTEKPAMASESQSRPEQVPEAPALTIPDSDPAPVTVQTMADQREAPSLSMGNGAPLLAGVVKPSQATQDLLNGPRGLYDPETGLGWESYLRDRLGSELRRSASFEQDLSILLISLDTTRRGDVAFNLFANTVRDFFTFKDMAFLFGSSGLAVLLPNIDIEHAIHMSEELLKKLTFQLQASNTSMTYLDLFMGLSSRSGRLVEADRLISEAMVAIRKARQERDTHIMAFKPDPEKFRTYLAGR
jgi:GGDEF domain-containing protein